jgi:hypothetical protein
VSARAAAPPTVCTSEELCGGIENDHRDISDNRDALGDKEPEWLKRQKRDVKVCDICGNETENLCGVCDPCLTCTPLPDNDWKRN